MLTFRDALAEHKLEALATFLPVEMLTFIQVNMNPHSVSYFASSSLPFPMLEPCPFYFLMTYSTEIKIKFSLRSQEIITSITGAMFQLDL